MLLFLAEVKLFSWRKALVTAWKRSKKGKSVQPGCPICSQRELGGAEVFELKGEAGASIFDVEKAKQIAADGRPVEQIPVNMLAQLIASSHYEKAHLPHVDPATPGIIGQRFTGFFILDGVHRAVRSLHEHRAFHAYVLTQQETLSCLVLQDLWESNVGMVVRELRQLLEEHPDVAYLEVQLASTPEALDQIRKLLTPEENARIKILPQSE